MLFPPKFNKRKLYVPSASNPVCGTGWWRHDDSGCICRISTNINLGGTISVVDFNARSTGASSSAYVTGFDITSG